MSDRVGAFERRHDAFLSRQEIESRQRFFVGHRSIGRPADLAQITVLRTDGRIIQSGGDGVCEIDLSVFILEQIGHGPLQDSS